MSSDNHGKILIDSHVFIWLLYEPERISPQAIGQLQSAKTIIISSASLWELALKHLKGKLVYKPANLLKGVDVLGLDVLHILPSHLTGLSKIKLPHNDPFDTMLVAQSLAEGCVLMTADHHILDSTYQTYTV